MVKRAALYKSLLLRYHATTSEVVELRRQLQASQGMSVLRHERIAVFFRRRVRAFSGIALIFMSSCSCR